MSQDQNKDFLRDAEKPEGNQDATGVPRQELKKNTADNTGMQSEQSGNNPNDYNQGSHTSGQNGMHNQQKAENLSSQGMHGERDTQAPGGHVGRNEHEDGPSLSGGTHRNDQKSAADESDSGQGSAGFQGQYAGQGTGGDIKSTEDANRQRKDFSTGDKLGENADRQGPDAMRKKTDQDDPNAQRKNYSDLSKENGSELDDKEDINKGI